jgi:hypothetical protein
MANVGAVISNIRNIMRQDRGISGDAQRLEQLGWMLSCPEIGLHIYNVKSVNYEKQKRGN